MRDQASQQAQERYDQITRTIAEEQKRREELLTNALLEELQRRLEKRQPSPPRLVISFPAQRIGIRMWWSTARLQYR